MDTESLDDTLPLANAFQTSQSVLGCRVDPVRLATDTTAPDDLDTAVTTDVDETPATPIGRPDPANNVACPKNLLTNNQPLCFPCDSSWFFPLKSRADVRTRL